MKERNLFFYFYGNELKNIMKIGCRINKIYSQSLVCFFTFCRRAPCGLWILSFFLLQRGRVYSGCGRLPWGNAIQSESDPSTDRQKESPADRRVLHASPLFSWWWNTSEKIFHGTFIVVFKRWKLILYFRDQLSWYEYAASNWEWQGQFLSVPAFIGYLFKICRGFRVKKKLSPFQIVHVSSFSQKDGRQLSVNDPAD